VFYAAFCRSVRGERGCTSCCCMQASTLASVTLWVVTLFIFDALNADNINGTAVRLFADPLFYVRRCDGPLLSCAPSLVSHRC
jgi:hypothetical protein